MRHDSEMLPDRTMQPQLGPVLPSAGASFDWLTSLDGGLCWLESQPAAGRSVVMRWRADLIEACDVPDGSGVGSSLHAYGGQPYAYTGSGLVAVSAATGQLIAKTGHTNDDFTYGDLACDAGEVFAVREREQGDELAAFGPDVTQGRVLLATEGFLASPRPFRGRLAWMRWDRDVMPWDSSEIWVADYAPGGQIGHARRVAGGPAESAVQPCWSPDGSLYFISDRSGWWNLYRWRDERIEPVAAMPAECATAPWESSYSSFALLPEGRVALAAHSGPLWQLLVVEPEGQVRAVDLPYTSIKPYLAAVGDRVGLIGASPTRVSEVALVATDGSDAVEVIRKPTAAVAAAEVSVPDVVQVDSAHTPITVLYYPPALSAGDGLPPLIVRPHAGPTYHSELRLDREVQFFTSRGFAVADVDYRGSTGYGRAFRKALDGNWGRYDVEDCRAAAEHLVASGRAHPSALFISGASAGGYTALKAVCVDGPFALAVARSAIIDPHRWRTTAPRFQRPHAAILSSATSPVVADEVRRPVLLLHGLDDRVAPAADADTLAAALDHRGFLVDMAWFADVGHYLSSSAQDAALEAELAAYHRALLRLGVATSAR